MTFPVENHGIRAWWFYAEQPRPEHWENGQWPEATVTELSVDPHRGRGNEGIKDFSIHYGGMEASRTSGFILLAYPTEVGKHACFLLPVISDGKWLKKGKPWHELCEWYRREALTPLRGDDKWLDFEDADALIRNIDEKDLLLLNFFADDKSEAVSAPSLPPSGSPRDCLCDEATPPPPDERRPPSESCLTPPASDLDRHGERQRSESCSATPPTNGSVRQGEHRRSANCSATSNVASVHHSDEADGASVPASARVRCTAANNVDSSSTAPLSVADEHGPRLFGPGPEDLLRVPQKYERSAPAARPNRAAISGAPPPKRAAVRELSGSVT